MKDKNKNLKGLEGRKIASKKTKILPETQGTGLGKSLKIKQRKGQTCLE